MLNEHEQKVWDEIVRDHRAEAREALPAVVVGGGWGAVLLVLFGVPMAGLAIGAATGLVWLLWRLCHGWPAPAPPNNTPACRGVDLAPGRRRRADRDGPTVGHADIRVSMAQ